MKVDYRSMLWRLPDCYTKLCLPCCYSNESFSHSFNTYLFQTLPTENNISGAVIRLIYICIISSILYVDNTFRKLISYLLYIRFDNNLTKLELILSPLQEFLVVTNSYQYL